MKRMWLAVTAALAAVLLVVGVMLLPFIYAGIFDTEKIIYEEEDLPVELLAAPGLFMDRFRYPLLEETESMPEDAREIHVEYYRSVQGKEMYERAFGLAGLQEEERYWNELTAVKGESLFLIRTRAEKDGEDCSLSVAMNDDLIPFLVCCRSGREPSEAELGEAVRALEELVRTGTDSLRAYTEEIDGIYENCREYQSRVTELYAALLPEENFVQEISETVPLWDCCARGEWQVCADEGEAVLVCIMGQGDLVLYYDAVAREFCGYRIRFGVRS